MNSFPWKTSFKTKSIWLLLLSVVFSVSCGNQTESNAGGKASSNSAQVAGNENSCVSNDDVAALGNQVLLAFVPEEVVWCEEKAKDSDNKKLTAVMKFTEEDAKNLVAQAEKHRPAEAVEVGTEQWFPLELNAQSRLSGNESLKGNSYAPTDFIQLPYKNGRLIKIEDSNYFILELSMNQGN
ncbi:MAG TPA: hypothetical protein VK400_06120 [Pyrinomonadaceae bacterium]|nr:hypothetical protein [Pyrinomonadaceae bacterium]